MQQHELLTAGQDVVLATLAPHKRHYSDKCVPAEASGVAEAASGRPSRRKTTQKAPTRSKTQIQDLRGEIEILTHQLESLQSDQLLGGSLEQFLEPSQRRRSFRSLVAQQKQLRKQAQTENAQLRKRLKKRLELTAAVKRLLRRQIQLAQAYDHSPIGLQRYRTIASDSAEDTGVFKLLCANLDRRCNELDRELSQCVSAADLVMLSQVVLDNDGGGVAFKSSCVLPFSAKAICDSLWEYTLMGAMSSSHDDRGLFVRKAALPAHLGSTFGPTRVDEQRRLEAYVLLRRIEQQHRTVLLWESMDAWPLEKSPDASMEISPPPPRIRWISWTVVEPVGDSACFLQGSLSIRKRDYGGGSGDGAVDPALFCMLPDLETFYIRQRQQYGSLLVDMSRKRSTSHANKAHA